MKDVDDLAQFIRDIDGNHTMGAGALAEAIVSCQLEALLADDVIERVARCVNELSGAGSMACVGCGIPGGYAEGCEDCKRVCERHARDVMEAALGIEGEQTNE